MNTTETKATALSEEITPEILNVLERLGFDPSNKDFLDTVIEDFNFNINGVYCSWNDSYFRDYDEAIEILKEDDTAIYSAFQGYITVEDRPYCENLNNGRVETLTMEELEAITSFHEKIIFIVFNMEIHFIEQQKAEATK